MAKPTPLEPPVTMAQRCRSELRSTSPKSEGAFHRSMKLRSSMLQSVRQTVIFAGSPSGSAAPVQTQVPSTRSRVELPNVNFEF